MTNTLHVSVLFTSSGKNADRMVVQDDLLNSTSTFSHLFQRVTFILTVKLKLLNVDKIGLFVVWLLADYF